MATENGVSYYVRFCRADGQPAEYYHYWRREDAEYHFGLMDHDESGLYTQVDFITAAGGLQSVSRSLHFDGRNMVC